jgi:hypothetical protein
MTAPARVVPARLTQTRPRRWEPSGLSPIDATESQAQAPVTDFRYPRIALSSATNPPDALDYFGVWRAVPMLLSGGLFVGGLVATAWERVPAWRASDLLDFRTGFAHTLRRMDRLQPALLVVCLGSTIGFAGSAGGAAHTLAGLAAGGLLVVLVGSVALLVPIQRRLVASGPPSPSPPCEHAVKDQGRQGGCDAAAQGVG